MSIKTKNCTGLTGGTIRDLDYDSVNVLSDGDRAIFMDNTGRLRFFKYDAASTATTDTTASPIRVRPADYSTSGVWFEQLYLSPSTVIFPAGYMTYWPSEVLPDRALARDGSSLLRTSYPELFAVLGTRYGAVDSAHFNLPDDRGLFIRGLDSGAGVDPDAGSRTDRGDGTAGDNVGTLQADEFKQHDHDVYGAVAGASGTNERITRSSSSTADILTGPSGGAETRPANRAYIPIIFY